MSNRRLLSAKSRNPKVQRPLEQDHRDGEVDDREKSLTKGTRPNPAKSIGSKKDTKQQQEDDARKPQVSGERLAQHTPTRNPMTAGSTRRTTVCPTAPPVTERGELRIEGYASSAARAITRVGGRARRRLG